MLAGIPKGPKYYSPYMDMKNAKDRQRTILQTMADQGIIQQRDAETAGAEMLNFVPLGTSKQDPASRRTSAIMSGILAVDKLGIDERLLSEGGIRIYTTLDPDAQRAAEEAVAAGIPERTPSSRPRSSRIDPRTGYIKAMVGGRDYKTNQYNRVFAETRQPGSSFKPILYLTALQEGVMTPVLAVQERADGLHLRRRPQDVCAEQLQRQIRERLIDMRQAIASSDNIYAVNSIMKVGPEKVIDMARQARHRQPNEAGPVAGARHVPGQPVRDGLGFRHVREWRRARGADGDLAHRRQQGRGAV